MKSQARMGEAAARQRRKAQKTEMQDKGTYGCVPTRLKVADVLVNYGKDVSFTRNGMIKSPFRDERTPSFHIMPEGYGWVDFGDGTKGGVIDLIMRLENCDRSHALRRIAEIKNGGCFFVQSNVTVTKRPRQPTCVLKVVSSAPLSDRSLILYAIGRGITEEVLRKYCMEIAVKVRGSQNIQSYIGFPNSTDGYVLRSPKAGRDGKRCTSSAPTYISPDGNQTSSPCSAATAVFEGFFDFMSFIEMHRAGSGLTPGCDICVLNSVANLNRALDFILRHQEINLFLDNDKAGREASAAIIQAAWTASADITVLDHSDEYAGYGDLNEFLQNGTL